MKTILCYGDSNTWGAIPRRNFEDIRRFEPNQRWTGILRQKLGQEYCVIEEGLRGRTTVWDDPIEGLHKNGQRYLLPCLESHQPIDLVILFLGTNDLKKRFSVSASDVALATGNLISMVRLSTVGSHGSAPQVLLLAPPPIAKMTFFASQFEDAEEKSKQLGECFAQLAAQQDCHFLNTASIVASSDIDGIHLDLKEHLKLGENLAIFIEKLFQDVES